MLDQCAHDEKSYAARASLYTALVLTVMKLSVGFYTNSLGILSEALHSGFDLLAALMTFFAVRVASLPADARHPYGHGKVENLAALGETALLLITCGWILGEAVERLFFTTTLVKPSLWGVLVMLISIALDIHRVRLLRRVAKKYKSQALEADALHFSSDILSSAVVLVGLLVIWGAQFLPAGNDWIPLLHSADALAALGVSLVVLHACYDLSRKAINDLMDAGSDEMRQRIEEAALAVAGVTHVHSVRMRSSGAVCFVDLTLCVPPRFSVESGHRLANEVEEAIRRIEPGADVTVHVEPNEGNEVEHPLLVLQNTAAQHTFSIHGVQLLQTEQGMHVEVHAEMPGSLPLGDAHHRVTSFENEVAALMPQVEIVSHLEPEGLTDWHASRTTSCTETERAQLHKVVEEVLGGGVSGCHRLMAYRLPESEGPGVHLSFHCRMNAAATVNEAHDASLRIERDLRQRLPHLGRIVVHMEPQEEFEPVERRQS